MAGGFAMVAQRQQFGHKVIKTGTNHFNVCPETTREICTPVTDTPWMVDKILLNKRPTSVYLSSHVVPNYRVVSMKISSILYVPRQRSSSGTPTASNPGKYFPFTFLIRRGKCCFLSLWGNSAVGLWLVHWFAWGDLCKYLLWWHETGFDTVGRQAAFTIFSNLVYREFCRRRRQASKRGIIVGFRICRTSRWLR